ncbi:MAG: 7-cyano-7-deazaguanine synthase QueC [Deferribacteraceae bacterium]|jgi:7-cyano-7-deazaguanine synthase|nr:7-cyano-7-deazaguanine synthase QueC [Deferribacteraceae bacterium]
MKAIVVLSGGMDSSVTVAIALEQGYDVALLHLNYGQRTEAKELSAFHSIADHYNLDKRLVVDISYLKEIGGSSLVDSTMPIEADGVDKSVLPSTYVPFRNANILCIATSWAEVIGASKIFIGAVEGDSSGYPDCTEIFYKKFNDLLDVALSKECKVTVETPLIAMTKSEIVAKGLELHVPFELTWSCYQSETAACGVCDSCRLRLKGFKELGLKDPIEYTTH